MEIQEENCNGSVMSFVDNFLKFIKTFLLHKFISSQDTVAIFRCQSWEANKLSRNQSEFVSKNSFGECPQFQFGTVNG